MSEHLAEKLLNVRKELEDLTGKYILEILKSKESADSHSRKLLTILNSIGEGVLVFDAEQKLVLANQAACNIIGSALPEMTRDQIRQMFTAYRKNSIEPLPPEEETLVIAMDERRIVSDELLLKGALFPPEGIWVRATAAPVIDADENLIGGVTVFQNISERIILQRQHDALVSLITHDLKNHFAAEHTVVELLRRHLSEKISTADLELLNELQRSSLHYGDLGCTLLEVFRTDVSDPTISKADINLHEVLLASVQLNALVSSRRVISLELGFDERIPAMKGTPSAWRQVFHNLIQNAIEASPDGATVKINAVRSPGGICVRVSDNGSGMTEEQCSKIFDSNKTEVPLKSVYSTGFGLYLCRFLIEAQGGTISCDSKVGSGTTFTVEINLNN